METWTAEQLFIATYIASALSGLAELLHSTRPVTIRSLFSAVLFYGAAGAGLGMVAYEYMGGKARPALVVACGLMVGIRVVTLSDIAEIIRKVFGTRGTDKKE